MGGNMGLMPTKKCIEEMQKAFPEGAEVEMLFIEQRRKTPAFRYGDISRLKLSTKYCGIIKTS